MTKVLEKNTAIRLRCQGKSYSEILAIVPVTKATLSEWLRGIELSAPQKYRLTKKMQVARSLGAQAKKDLRIAATKKIIISAAAEVHSFDQNVFTMLGAALYWAEGTKQKEHNVSQRVVFCNSDPKMVKFFYSWLVKICHVSLEQMYFEIYIHQDANSVEARKFWSTTLGLPIKLFYRVRYKKGNKTSYRKNKGDNYYGLLRVTVRKSTALNRKILGWIEGIYRNGMNFQHSGIV